jgi:hypothetical protein
LTRWKFWTTLKGSLGNGLLVGWLRALAFSMNGVGTRGIVSTGDGVVLLRLVFVNPAPCWLFYCVVVLCCCFFMVLPCYFMLLLYKHLFFLEV